MENLKKKNLKDETALDLTEAASLSVSKLFHNALSLNYGLIWIFSKYSPTIASWCEGAMP